MPYLVVKLDAASVPDLPAPRPKFELFVYSPRFEGVHLRFANVARGGLRWSDRREDFRTEILGLAKAQEVKNSVIVPSGSKGGFVCKQLPDPSDREAYQGEVLACYRMFISAMLDVTDNLVDGKVVAPDRLVRHDGDDPYLVVAADKGTATFSDTANEIAASHGFWLGDAFASGGSAGYDHKKMGITARGAWESVRFHFQTLGIDVDSADFTVAGIGDMSGDVFGNGMLLSGAHQAGRRVRPPARVPGPGPGPGGQLRRAAAAVRAAQVVLGRLRPLADLGRAAGCGRRSAKSVPVSPQARAALGLEDRITALAPDQLISAILAAPVDLLWNGGIGTYVKATTQVHADAGDRSNDAVRVDASQLRARVVGEGGNLGLTQEARIEYALAGGLVNTDFIDNSAGVDTSDHEVNIKILLDGVVRDGELTPADRNALLHQMTDEVATLVLEHNYQQNRALAAARAQAGPMLHVHARYIRKLERDRKIRRRLEVLPGDKEIAERRSAGTGLTLPEFSVLLAHTKIGAAQDVLASALPDDPYLARVLTEYFPVPLRERYYQRMHGHRLHREIITTVVVNDMVDRSGTTFAFRLNEETGASVPDITAAWLVAREVFDLAGFWRLVEALDRKVDSQVQILALLEGRKLTERAARWLLNFRRPPYDVRQTIDFFAEGVLTVGKNLPRLLAGLDLAGYEEQREHVRVPRGARRPGPADRRDGPGLLGLRHRGHRGRHRAAGRGDRRGLLRPGRPAADRPAAGPDHRAAQGRPVEHHGPRRAAGRPVQRARRAGQGRADGDRVRAAGGPDGRLGAAQRVGGEPGEPDADRDLGERRLVQRGNPVGRGPRGPHPGRDQHACPAEQPASGAAGSGTRGVASRPGRFPAFRRVRRTFGCTCTHRLA